MKRAIGGALVYVIMIGILIGMLQVLNWLPSVLQEGAFQRFDSIEQAAATTKIGRIYSPAYYPRSVRWPPSLIAAQTRPYAAVVIEYLRSDADGMMLVVTQTAAGKRPLLDDLALVTVRESVPYRLKDRPAQLEVGACRDADLCSRISWTEGPYRLVASMQSSPMDLVRIAESMIPAGKQGQSSAVQR